MGRRDSNDPEWRKVKEIVKKRDHDQCRFIQKCNPFQLMQMRRVAPSAMMMHNDPAHVFPAGRYLHMIYDPENIVTLCRWVHDCLDNCKHPLTGELIERDRRDALWRYIVGDEVYDRLQSKAYGDDHGRAEEDRREESICE